MSIRDQTAIWISRVPAYHLPGDTVTRLRLDTRLVTLALHAGSSEPGGRGWRYGDAIRGAERNRVLAAFNGALPGGLRRRRFRGRRARRLAAATRCCLRGHLPRRGGGHRPLARQRPGPRARAPPPCDRTWRLLIDRRRIAATVDTCIKVCWGDPLHEQPIVARSGLGITRQGDLIWAAGSPLSVRALAQALAAAGAVRAMELDINPAWVAGLHLRPPRRTRRSLPLPLVAGQIGIAGQFLAPYFRDFFSVLPRPGSGRAG